MALDMWSELTVTRVEDPSAPMLTITCEGEGEDELPRDETNLVVIAVKVAFEKAGLPLVPLHYHCNNRIPFGRGLGSSSAAVVSGLIAGLALCGCELKVFGEGALTRGGNQIEPEELLQLAAKIEGHPDNVCPAIYGGIQLGIQVGENQWRSCRVNCPTDLQLVAFISDSVGKTSELRSVLSDTVSRAEAVFNIGRTAFLVNALNSNKLYDLRWGTQDALHQPQRAARLSAETARRASRRARRRRLRHAARRAELCRAAWCAGGGRCGRVAGSAPARRAFWESR
jgi:homoserine kinase